MTGRWPRRVGAALLTGLAAWGLTAAIGLRPQPILVVTTAAAWVLGATIVFELDEHRRTVELGAPRRPGVSRHGLDPQFSRLARSLRDGPDPQHVAEQVHAALTDVVDDLLLARHGIDRARDPAAARSVISPELLRYLDEVPHERRNQTAYLTDITRRIEAL